MKGTWSNNKLIGTVELMTDTQTYQATILEGSLLI